MPKYIIEREIPGAGKLSAQQLKSISHPFVSFAIFLAIPVYFIFSERKS